MLPSVESSWAAGKLQKPRVRVLAVRDPQELDKAPVAHLLFDRQETSRVDPKDGTVYEASITLSYKRIMPKGLGNRRPPSGEFRATFSRYSGLGFAAGAISLTGGAVYLDLPGLNGHRIGTYLLDEIVEWAGQWPEASIQQVEFWAKRPDPENQARRNRLFEQFGMKFLYSDPEQMEGKSLPMQVKALNRVDTWSQNIEEIDLFDKLSNDMGDNQELKWALDGKNQSYSDLHEAYRYREDYPVLYAVQRTWWRLRGFALVFGPLVFFAWLLYRQYR